MVIGVFTDEVPMLKPALSRNILSAIENRPKISFFLRKWGQNVRVCFRDPKRYILARNDVFRRIGRQTRRSGLAVASWKTPKNQPSEDLMGNFAYAGEIP